MIKKTMNSAHLATPVGLALMTVLASPAAAQEQASADDTSDRSNVDLAGEVQILRQKVDELEAEKARAAQRESMLLDRLERLEALLGQEPVSNADAQDMRGRYAPPQARAQPADPNYGYTIYSAQPDDQPAGGGSAASSGGASGDTTIGDGSITTAASGDVEERKAPAPTEAVEEVAEQRQGRFGQRIGFELGLDYSHFDNARINLNGFLALDSIFLGTISIDQTTADIFSVDPTINLGLTSRLSISADIPYLYRTSNFRSGGAGGNASGLVEETIHYDGWGDATVGASYRLLRETARRPDIVVNLRGKAPTGKDPFGVELREIANSQSNLYVPQRLSTGSGVWGASVGVSALKTIDPMVVFGSVTYFHNFEREFADIDEADGDQPGRVDVGDAFQIGAGLAYALNEKSSISMSYTQRVVHRTRVRRSGQDWQTIVGSQANVGFVNLGATFSLAKNVSLISSFGIGLTDDSPDMAVSLRLPIRF